MRERKTKGRTDILDRSNYELMVVKTWRSMTKCEESNEHVTLCQRSHLRMAMNEIWSWKKHVWRDCPYSEEIASSEDSERKRRRMTLSIDIHQPWGKGNEEKHQWGGGRRLHDDLTKENVSMKSRMRKGNGRAASVTHQVMV